MEKYCVDYKQYTITIYNKPNKEFGTVYDIYDNEKNIYVLRVGDNANKNKNNKTSI